MPSKITVGSFSACWKNTKIELSNSRRHSFCFQSRMASCKLHSNNDVYLLDKYRKLQQTWAFAITRLLQGLSIYIQQWLCIYFVGIGQSAAALWENNGLGLGWRLPDSSTHQLGSPGWTDISVSLTIGFLIARWQGRVKWALCVKRLYLAYRKPHTHPKAYLLSFFYINIYTLSLDNIDEPLILLKW